MRQIVRIHWWCVVLVSVIAAFATSVMACSCETYGKPRSDAKDYYLTKFNGAIFSGTVTSVKNEPDNGGITLSEVSFDVDTSWVGVKKRVVVIKTFGPGTDCSPGLTVGTKTFIIAGRHDRTLFFSACELVNWPGSYPNTEWSDYTSKTLGKGRTFPPSD